MTYDVLSTKVHYFFLIFQERKKKKKWKTESPISITDEKTPVISLFKEPGESINQKMTNVSQTEVID